MQKILLGKKVDVTALFEKCGISAGKIEITEAEGMYPYKERIDDNWTYFTGVGMKKLKETLDQEGKQIEKVGLIGIGSGVEGILFLNIFKDSLEKLVVTDVDQDVLNGAVVNIHEILPESKVTPLFGSFCEPVERAGIVTDLVYGNIPNLPARDGDDLKSGAEKGTFLPTQLYDIYNPPREFVDCALAAQYAYLMSAKKIISDEGSVITELGGRVPMTLVQKLFDSCGLKLQDVVVGFKEQTEALIDFEGYHALEKACGVSFEFYLFEKSRELLSSKKIQNPTNELSSEEIKELLKPHQVSASEALKFYHQGIAVGHTVHVLRGIK